MHANASLPPLPLAQRMTPTQRMLSFFFQSFFSDTFSNAFFRPRVRFLAILGSQMEAKMHQNAFEKAIAKKG